MDSTNTTRLWQALLATPDALLADCRRETYQGSGAGGQKRNRVRSGVRLVHEPTGMRAENCEHREAGRNVAEALHGLRLQMALSMPHEIPQEARQRFRIAANSAHADYAITLALSLQALHEAKGRISEAAQALGCSGSALTRHFKADKSAWAAALRLRQSMGLGPLK